MTQSFKAEQEAKMLTEAMRLERKIAALKKDHGAELALDEKAIEHQQKHPDLPYSACLEAAMQENPDLRAEYIASFGAHKLSPEQVKTFNVEIDDDDDRRGGSEAAGIEIDKLVKKWLAQNNLDASHYEKGLGHVLQAHPELAKRWMGR